MYLIRLRITTIYYRNEKGIKEIERNILKRKYQVQSLYKLLCVGDLLLLVLSGAFFRCLDPQIGRKKELHSEWS